MPVKVLIGGLLGILTGVFLGERATFLEPVGRAYVLLVQAVVYPYIIASLLHGMGSMSPSMAGRLFRRGMPMYVIVWGLTFCIMLVVAIGLPVTDQIVFRPSHDEIESIDTLLDLILPSDPFQALSENHMPAIVIFCLIFGATIQYVERKSELLAMLNAVNQASLLFWGWTTQLVPYAIFALFAVAAGTVSVQALPQIALYLGLLALGCLMLALWILPMLVVAIAPTAYREVMSEMKEAITIVVATTVTAAALPCIIALTRRLAEKAGAVDEHRDDVIATNISIGYAIGTVGALFLYLFLLFAGTYFRTTPDLFQSLTLPLVVLLSSAGSAVAALGFIGSWLNLPPDIIQLYIETSTLAFYAQLVLSVVSLAFLSIAVTLNYYGRLKIRPDKVALALVLPFALAAAGAWGMGWLNRAVDEQKAMTYNDLRFRPADTYGVEASFDDGKTTTTSPPNAGEAADSFATIQSTGVLRVGINEGAIPFSYRNKYDELVGYDIAFAYELANVLGVDLAFVPFEYDDLATDLKSGRFDIAASGLYVTEDRLRDLIATNPYHRSSPALFGHPDVITTLDDKQAIIDAPDLTVGVFESDALVAGLRRQLPGVDITVVPDYSQLPDFDAIDAAVWSLSQAKAIAQSNSDLAVIVPEEMGDPFVFVYYLAPEDRLLHTFVNSMIGELKSTGWQHRQESYWLKGHGGLGHKRRWSILDNVFGWDSE